MEATAYLSNRRCNFMMAKSLQSQLTRGFAIALGDGYD